MIKVRLNYTGSNELKFDVSGDRKLFEQIKEMVKDNRPYRIEFVLEDDKTTERFVDWL